ncbi:N-succinylarginine dihydrolase [Klebsiella pneumoniae]
MSRWWPAGGARRSRICCPAFSSASSMWVANAATVRHRPPIALDGLVHLTVANLQDKLHRAQRGTDYRGAAAGAIFPDRTRLCLSTRRCRSLAAWFGDEGAANHNRFGRRVWRCPARSSSSMADAPGERGCAAVTLSGAANP